MLAYYHSSLTVDLCIAYIENTFFAHSLTASPHPLGPESLFFPPETQLSPGAPITLLFPIRKLFFHARVRMVIKLELLGTPTLLACSAGVLVLWYITTAFHSWYRMRHIPGPFLASFSYLWHFYIAWTDQTGPVFSDLHNRYANGGPFVRISPNYVVTRTPCGTSPRLAEATARTNGGGPPSSIKITATSAAPLTSSSTTA
jgi:hypothetical protein